MFRHSLPGADPGQYVRLAAALGFRGVQFAWALSRAPEDIESFARAVEETGIVGSCVVSARREEFFQAFWGLTGKAVIAEVQTRMHRACEVARKLHSCTVAIVAVGDPDRPAAPQRRALVDNLRQAARIAADYDITLVVETMRTVDNMLLGSYRQLHDLVQEVDHPSVRMLFDTYHVCVMDGRERMFSSFVEWYDRIGLIQLADYPDKLEPGAGTIDFPPLLACAMQRGYSGLIELEHVWACESAAGEQEGLHRLRSIDVAAYALAKEPAR